MADVERLAQAGLKGWRTKVADVAAPPVAQRTPLGEEQVRAVVGAAFFVLATMYVAKTLKTLVDELR
jgi:hypothetical protein